MTKLPPPAILLNPAIEDQEAIVELLEQALDEARAGRIHTIGVVVCMDQGFASVMAGRRAGDLNLGCDELKQRILDAVKGNAPPARSSAKIIRARS